MFGEQAKQELFETVKAFHACKQEDSHSVSSYLLKMKSYLDTLERLGFPKPNELGVSLILNYVNKDYEQFVQNYNMHSMEKTFTKLHAMLKLTEKRLSKKAHTPTILAIRGGLRESMKLKHGALSLYVGNGMRAAVEAIGSFDLVLPSGLIIVLDNCHFAPTSTRGVVSLSRLVNNGYLHSFTNYGISVSKDDVFYLNAIPRDGIYEIDMHNLYPNDMMTKFEKLDKFKGSDFRRWQKKMNFLLTTLKVVNVLTAPMPEYVEEETLEETRKRCKSLTRIILGLLYI
ncbi:hypothetical protein Tco_0317285 [Tanacetum coccineum]